MKYMYYKGAGKKYLICIECLLFNTEISIKLSLKPNAEKAGVAVRFELAFQNKTVLANEFSVKGRDKSTQQLSKIIRKNLLLAIHSAMHGE